MHFPPPEVQATWPAPNSTNPERRGPALLIVELTILPLALACLILRLYVRMRVVHSRGWDDYLMVAAAICGTGVTTCTILATQLFGWSTHVWDVTPDQLVEGRKTSLASHTLFAAATGLAKSSILVSYLRIAPERSWFRRLSWATLGLVAIVACAAVISLWSQCSPIWTYWHMRDQPEGACVDEGVLMLALAVCNMATDLLVYVLPVPTLAALSLPVAQRVATIALFSLGLVVVLAGCMRAYWIATVLVADAHDFTWESYNLWIWTAVEVQLGVICGCVPVLKPLFFMALGRWDGVETRRRGLDSGDDEFGFDDDLPGSKAYMDHLSYARSIYSSHAPTAAAVEEEEEPVPPVPNQNRFSFTWGSQGGMGRTTNVVVEVGPADVVDDRWGWGPPHGGLPPPPRPPRPDSANGFEFSDLARAHTAGRYGEDELSRSWSPTGVRTIITADAPPKAKTRSLRW